MIAKSTYIERWWAVQDSNLRPRACKHQGCDFSPLLAIAADSPRINLLRCFGSRSLRTGGFVDDHSLPLYSMVRRGAIVHTIKEKEKLIWRVRRVRGQVEAVERALTNEDNCSDVLRLIAATRGAMNALMAELLEDLVRFHVLDPKRKPTSDQAVAADELVDAVKAYLK